MKTTVDLPDDLLIRAKKRAAETRTPLRALIARGLQRELSAEGGKIRTRDAPVRIRWVTEPGGLPPGLDVADREALHAWKDARR
ncbi:MAG: hypothetical protein NTU62_01555 [Spirochaetes bacterium]|jgi:hypothetical protein|nr:hypothetical protein [Spirochaetota bacterium]